MARFSDDTIQRLKSETSLVGVVQASGITLKPHGKDKIGHCPFHDDKNIAGTGTRFKSFWLLT